MTTLNSGTISRIALPALLILTALVSPTGVGLAWSSDGPGGGTPIDGAAPSLMDRAHDLHAGALAGQRDVHPLRLAPTGADHNEPTAAAGPAESETGGLEEVGQDTLAYPVADTGQQVCYDDTAEIACPEPGEPFYGQDAQVQRNQPSYTVAEDGLTVHDTVTGLTWTQSPDLDGDGDIDVDDKLSFAEAQTYADTTLNPQSFGGYDDWRMPTIKELYSLMDFGGTDPTGPSPIDLTPFIDTDVFNFGYGDESAGERLIDAQFWSSSAYVGTVFGSQSAAFGLNLADGRIKGYPTGGSGPVTKLNYVTFVRGNTDYGVNDFVDNGDGTITDRATGLMWSQDDSGPQVNLENEAGDSGPRSGMTWEEALAWVEEMNEQGYLGYSDWRLPNAKEMQSLVDYSRAPDVTRSAAIDPVFNVTEITNEADEADYPWFWTSTTHARSDGNGSAGVYICFGRAMGHMHDQWMDVHGAGAQRSDRKSDDTTGLTYTPNGFHLDHSPQGDAIRSYNYVRPVRDAGASEANSAPMADAGGPYVGVIGEAIELDGSGSADVDGALVEYAWDLDGDGQYDDATGPTPIFSSTVAGVHTITLQVTDDQGAKATDAAPVTVSDAAPPPDRRAYLPLVTVPARR